MHLISWPKLKMHISHPAFDQKNLRLPEWWARWLQASVLTQTCLLHAPPTVPCWAPNGTHSWKGLERKQSYFLRELACILNTFCWSFKNLIFWHHRWELKRGSHKKRVGVLRSMLQTMSGPEPCRFFLLGLNYSSKRDAKCTGDQILSKDPSTAGRSCLALSFFLGILKSIRALQGGVAGDITAHFSKDLNHFLLSYA